MQENNNTPEISVVIPCLNEERTIGICVKKAIAAIELNGLSAEVIVSDNGSTDRSAEIASSLGARVVKQRPRIYTNAFRKGAEESGYGNSMRRGIEESRGKFIIMGDADDSYDFSELHRFAEKWKEGYEFVMGTRLKGRIMPGAMPWHHQWIGNPMLTAILNSFFKARVSDVCCGMRGFTREAYERMDIRTTGMEFALELVAKAAKLGLRITEIPITLYPDKRDRPPHLKSFRDGWRILRFLLMFSPTHLFLVPGTVLSLLGSLILLVLAPGPLHVMGTVLDVHSMIMGMVFVLMGLNVIFLGFFAKVFSYTEALDKNDRIMQWLFKYFNLESGLLIGCIVCLAGFAGDTYLFAKWATSGFGPLSGMRLAIISSTAFLVGLQTIFSSFFLSMLGISRGTYIGEYELKKKR